MSEGQRYDKEFKREIAKLFLSGMREVKSLANEVGVHENTIYKWAEAYGSDLENSFPGSGHLKPEADYYTTMQQATLSLSYFIDVYYNCKRLHAALGYKSPKDFENQRKLAV